jgi:hypothetical protein
MVVFNFSIDLKFSDLLNTEKNDSSSGKVCSGMGRGQPTTFELANNCDAESEDFHEA